MYCDEIDHARLQGGPVVCPSIGRIGEDREGENEVDHRAREEMELSQAQRVESRERAFFVRQTIETPGTPCTEGLLGGGI